MEKKNFHSYILYAIGEIALVVIGILIALQINNWNADKKERNEESRILSNLVRDLSRDTVQLNGLITDANVILTSLNSLYVYMYRPEKVNGETFLNKAYSMASGKMFEVNSVTFQESVSSGTLKYIQNDMIRQDIFEYYRNTIENRTDKFINEIRHQIIWPISFKKLSTNKQFMDDIGKPTSLPDLDVYMLSEDPEFIGMVNNSFTNTRTKVISWRAFLSDAKLLMGKLKTELEH